MPKLLSQRLGAALFGLAVLLSAIVSPATADDGPGKIAILTPEPGTDFGWNQQGVEAARKVAEKAGLELVVAEGLGYGDVRPTMRELIEEGADMLIAHASGYNAAGAEVALETDTPVAIVELPEAVEPGRVADYSVSGHEGAYLAGILAARMSRAGTLGIVVSGEPPAWNAQSAAFAQGAHAADPEARLLYAVIGPAAYADAAGGKRVTETLIAAGADVIFGQGDGSSFGMLQAVETTPALDGGKVWFIDVIGDKRPLDRGHLLSSVLWDLAPVYQGFVDDLKAGEFGERTYGLSLKSGSVGLIRTDYIPEAVWSEVEGARAAIESGELIVEPVYDADEVRALMTNVEAGE